MCNNCLELQLDFANELVLFTMMYQLANTPIILCIAIFDGATTHHHINHLFKREHARKE